MQATNRKWLVVCFVLFLLTVYLYMIEVPYLYYQDFVLKEYEDTTIRSNNLESSDWRGLTPEQHTRLSKLGEILFLGANYPNISDPKNYSILVWKHGKSIERRHILHYTNKRFDPFGNCSVRNCRLTYHDSDLSTADLVLFHLHRTRNKNEVPKRNGNDQQIWAFLTDESPFNTFLYSKSNAMKNYNGLFNWSMTYRMDSDIPVPYGRTLLQTSSKEEPDFAEWNKNKKQDILIAIMGSNCGGNNNRWKYVAELKKHIAVDVYGACGTLKCPGHFTKDCAEISKYKFYLSFENSNCNEYITEKLWWNGYEKNAVPIVMGGSNLAYKQLLPPKSYINTDEFASPRDLANYIVYLNSTTTEFKEYLSWKRYYKVVNEHGYFRSTSFHYCRICEALNYNSKDNKVYNNLEKFWSKNDCSGNSWNTH